ncbi:MAG: desulfoferrodoxin [Lachnospiraceae bacterium]|nr:desulfoferrodoxin [Lachnospiraceae bacterium]
MKFYRCEHCGQIVAIVKGTGVPIICCGQPMTEMVPGTVDASLEKHVPVVEVNGSKVTVKIGSAEHPMLDEHYIEWVALQTKFGNQRKSLKPGDKPEVCFALCEGDEVVAAYEHCNLHGLWRS